MKRRPLDFRSIDEAIVDLDRLQRTGYTKAGNWSLGEACNHIAIFVRNSMDGFTQRPLPWHVRIMAPLFVWWMLRTRSMPKGVKIPKELLPQGVTDDGAEVGELKRQLLRFREHKGPLHASPFGGHTDFDTWRELHLVHCAHHLSFLHPTELTAH